MDLDEEDAKELEVAEPFVTIDNVHFYEWDKYIDFSFSEVVFTEFPQDLLKLVNLEMVNLSGSKITSIPSEIKNLKNLQQFYMMDNLLTGLPKELFELENLEVLHLSNNQLTSLPEEIGNLVNLDMLSLEGNNIGKLPFSIRNLRNLREFLYLKDQDERFPKEVIIDDEGIEVKVNFEEFMKSGKSTKAARV